MKLINLNYRAGKNTKVGTPTLPEAMERAVGLMAPDRHVANRVIILVSAVYRSTDIQSVKGRIYFANIFNKKWPNSLFGIGLKISGNLAKNQPKLVMFLYRRHLFE